ncbi:F-box/FBD/LRR-repeat protein At1g13570-like isoform X2 [Primulina eburnea]|uniref:F-box/FBD/LRR-repeat protein At1g13570-like isoform X2 n=1 Tax=Primulina eburnea TaxID=1245227 RepID=UPI003C6C0770
MENDFYQDLIGELPQCLIEIILTKLPVRDAVRTSILSRDWRFKWASLMHLVLNDRRATHGSDRSIGTPDVDQWLLFMPWKETKELILELGELSVHPSKHKYLILEGEIKDKCLAKTPNLAAISVAMTEVSAEHFERSSGCNLNKFLGDVPRFQRLIGHICFTEGWNPLTYQHLKFIEFHQVSFVDEKEVYLVLRLIENSPNLLELQISGSSNPLAATKDCDLDFWARKISSDFLFHRLETVKMIGVYGGPLELSFMEYLLKRSPRLEIMRIRLRLCTPKRKFKILCDMLRFRRKSPRASVLYDPDQG